MLEAVTLENQQVKKTRGALVLLIKANGGQATRPLSTVNFTRKLVMSLGGQSPSTTYSRWGVNSHVKHVSYTGPS